MSAPATLPVTSSELGRTPEDWAVDTLAGLGGQVTSGSRGWAAFYADYGDLFVRITNLRRDNIHLNLADQRFVLLRARNAEEARTRLEGGDLLVSITADIGIIGYVDERVPSPAYINQHIARVRLPADRVSSKFVAYYLSSWAPQRIFVGATDTGAKAGMNLATVGALKTVVPPLREQIQIAAALSDADEQIASLQRLIAKNEAITRALMQQLLTGKTRLPGYVGPWAEVRLGELAQFSKGMGLPKSSLLPGGRIPCIHYGELFTHYGAVIQRVTNRTNDETCRVRSSALDVLMPTSDVTPRGLAKASSVVDDGVALGGDILVIRPAADRLFGPFLAYAIRLHANQVLHLVRGSTVFHIYATDMKTFRFKVPDLAEQRAICDVLRECQQELDELESRLVKARAVKTGMKQQLLTGRTRLSVAEAVA